MRIDVNQLSMILNAFLDSDKSDFRMPSEWYKDDNDCENFAFHLELLFDQGFIVSRGSDPQSTGLRRTGKSGWIVSIIPLRLTADGHNFAAALSKPGVLKQLKSTFVELGPSETVKAAFKLGAKAFDKKLTELIED